MDSSILKSSTYIISRLSLFKLDLKRLKDIYDWYLTKVLHHRWAQAYLDGGLPLIDFVLKGTPYSISLTLGSGDSLGMGEGIPQPPSWALQTVCSVNWTKSHFPPYLYFLILLWFIINGIRSQKNRGCNEISHSVLL